jgi:hypothetical protein
VLGHLQRLCNVEYHDKMIVCIDFERSEEVPDLFQCIITIVFQLHKL